MPGRKDLNLQPPGPEPEATNKLWILKMNLPSDRFVCPTQNLVFLHSADPYIAPKQNQ
jgi:hypothetical protein